MTRPFGITLTVAALVLAGCVRSMPPLERYRLSPVSAPAAAEESAGRGSGAVARPTASRDAPRATIASVRIEPYVTEGIYADPQIVYRTGESQYAAYPNREWALPLSSMLADLTGEVVREMSANRVRVLTEAEGGATDFIWRGAVHEFEEVNRGDQVLAAVRFEATLHRASDDSLLWQGTGRAEQPVTGDSMEAVVAALSRLGTETVTSMVKDAARAVMPR